MTIIFDSGVRTGSDVFKAIALGAHAVMVGRLYVWGMAHEGEAGCRHVMKSLLAVRINLYAILVGNIYTERHFTPVGFGHNDDRCGLPLDHTGCLP